MTMTTERWYALQCPPDSVLCAAEDEQGARCDEPGEYAITTFDGDSVVACGEHTAQARAEDGQMIASVATFRFVA